VLRPLSDVLCALAGVALGALVFLPWWETDPGLLRPASPSPGTLGYLNLYAPAHLSPWDGLRGAALIWLATGALAALPVVARRSAARAPTLRRLQAILVAAGMVSLMVAVVRVAEPPADVYSPTAPAYLGVLLIAAITALAARGLRRP